MNDCFISPRQLARTRRLVVSSAWTATLHRLYPPSQREPRIVVAWDPGYNGGRWGLCREEEALLKAGGAVTPVRYVRLFYYWQGPGDSFLTPSFKMADWLREHDLYSVRHAGEWEDKMFGNEDQLREKARADWRAEVRDGAKALYDQYGKRLGLEDPNKAPRQRLSNRFWTMGRAA